MKIYTSGIDANGRSTSGAIEFVMKSVSPTERVSSRQPGAYVYLMITYPRIYPQNDKDYDPPRGVYEQHVGTVPHMPIVLTGHWDSHFQDGTVRYGPGDIHITRCLNLHHSNKNGRVPVYSVEVFLPGSATNNLEYSPAGNFAPLVDAKGVPDAFL